jgi:putative transposase
VLNLYSRRLIGWTMEPGMETSLPLDALNMTLRQRRSVGQVLHHSDRGCQYASGTWNLSAGFGWERLHRFHESQGKLLRHRHDGVVLKYAKTRAEYRRKFMTRNEAYTAMFDYIGALKTEPACTDPSDSKAPRLRIFPQLTRACLVKI